LCRVGIHIWFCRIDCRWANHVGWNEGISAWNANGRANARLSKRRALIHSRTHFLKRASGFKLQAVTMFKQLDVTRFYCSISKLVDLR
jgi:hypothetical protein